MAWRAARGMVCPMPRTPEDAPTDADALIRAVTVVSVDPAAGTCTVRLDDAGTGGDDAISPPVRWLHPRMGDIRAWLPPATGEQGLLLCPGGELAGAVFVGGLHCNAFPPPIDEPVALLRFKDGAAISYDPEAHELRLELPSGATTVLVSDGGIDLQGDVAITGALSVSETVTASDDVIGGGKSLKDHRHTGVAAGAAQSGPPA
ncbi:MAG: phage baseplate assembly protein V [Novosphingobium sp.]